MSERSDILRIGSLVTKSWLSSIVLAIYTAAQILVTVSVALYILSLPFTPFTPAWYAAVDTFSVPVMALFLGNILVSALFGYYCYQTGNYYDSSGLMAAGGLWLIGSLLQLLLAPFIMTRPVTALVIGGPLYSVMYGLVDLFVGIFGVITFIFFVAAALGMGSETSLTYFTVSAVLMMAGIFISWGQIAALLVFGVSMLRLRSRDATKTWALERIDEDNAYSGRLRGISFSRN